MLLRDVYSAVLVGERCRVSLQGAAVSSLHAHPLLCFHKYLLLFGVDVGVVFCQHNGAKAETIGVHASQ